MAIFCIAIPFWGAELYVGPGVVENLPAETLQEKVAHLALLADAASEVVSLLFSLSVGLFVLIGASLNRQGYRPGRPASAAILLFFVSSAASLYFAYLARMHILDFVGVLYDQFQPIAAIITNQVIGLSASAVFAVFVVVDAYSQPRGVLEGNEP